MTKYTEEFHRERVERIAADRGYKFHGWSGAFSGNATKLILECPDHGEWRTTSINHFIQPGRRCPVCAKSGGSLRGSEYYQRIIDSKSCYPAGTVVIRDMGSGGINLFCPECANDDFCKIGGFSPWFESTANRITSGIKTCRCSRGYRWSQGEREFAIKMRCEPHGYEFKGWAGGSYENKSSKVEIRCPEHGDFYPALSNFLYLETRCPRCARYGYNSDCTGYIYTLLSDCKKYVKIGVTNNMRLRLNGLRSSTPFGFSVVDVTQSSGAVAIETERKIHGDFESANMKGFSGSTEWMMYHPDLLEAARLAVSRADDVQ